MLKIHDSYSDKEVEIKSKDIVLYVCGLTPYDDCHIGHLRTYIGFDLLKRALIYRGAKVFHIQNVTDVDDKLIRRAKELGKNVLAIADYYEYKSRKLFEEFNIILADSYPRVSQYIEQIIKMVEVLLEKGYAYETETGVYFEVDKFKEYGKLSKQTKENLLKHRIEVDKTKKKPYDFALWKKEEDLIFWESPFGKGRPGWHIECSAMGISLANKITIHGGGRDLIFPHHENEIAQSDSYLGRKHVENWMHTGHLMIKGTKMSKSLGNFITVEEALKRWGKESLRMFFISRKYSSEVNFDEENIKEAKSSFYRIINFIESLESSEGGERRINKEIEELRQGFFENIYNDLDTPQALSHLFEFIRKTNPIIGEIHKRDLESSLALLKDILFILGLDRFYEERKKKLNAIKEGVEKILEAREKLREKKLFEISDGIREGLEKLGIEVKDFKKGSKFSLKEEN